MCNEAYKIGDVTIRPLRPSVAPHTSMGWSENLDLERGLIRLLKDSANFDHPPPSPLGGVEFATIQVRQPNRITKNYVNYLAAVMLMVMSFTCARSEQHLIKGIRKL